MNIPGIPDSALAVYWAIALIASAILVLQILAMVLGFGDLDSSDFDELDLEGADGSGYISFRSLTGFFGGFGWTGVILLEGGASFLVATGAGLVVGAALMFAVASFMRFIYSLRESGTINYANAIGQVGTVYLPIPPLESGPGQVQVLVQGRMKIVAAYAKAPETIPSASKVRVLALVDTGTVLVEPLGPVEQEERSPT